MHILSRCFTKAQTLLNGDMGKCPCTEEETLRGETYSKKWGRGAGIRLRLAWKRYDDERGTRQAMERREEGRRMSAGEGLCSK